MFTVTEPRSTCDFDVMVELVVIVIVIIEIPIMLKTEQTLDLRTRTFKTPLLWIMKQLID